MIIIAHFMIITKIYRKLVLVLLAFTIFKI